MGNHEAPPPRALEPDEFLVSIIRKLNEHSVLGPLAPNSYSDQKCFGVVRAETETPMSPTVKQPSRENMHVSGEPRPVEGGCNPGTGDLTQTPK